MLTRLLSGHARVIDEGGTLDGVLGVLAALECVRAMQDAGIEPAIAIEVGWWLALACL